MLGIRSSTIIEAGRFELSFAKPLDTFTLLLALLDKPKALFATIDGRPSNRPKPAWSNGARAVPATDRIQGLGLVCAIWFPPVIAFFSA